MHHRLPALPVGPAVGRFLERLEAATAEPGTPLEVHALLGRMTLEAIGRSAFG